MLIDDGYLGRAHKDFAGHSGSWLASIVTRASVNVSRIFAPLKDYDAVIAKVSYYWTIG